jgi:aldehyde dehydrogenase (NAD+)
MEAVGEDFAVRDGYHAIASRVARFSAAPQGLLQFVQGRAEVGQTLAADPRVPLVSATGSAQDRRSAR